MTVRGSCTAVVRLIAAPNGARDSGWSRRFCSERKCRVVGTKRPVSEADVAFRGLAARAEGCRRQTYARKPL